MNGGIILLSSVRIISGGFMNSHYVPQFILKGFCKNKQLTCCDFDSKSTFVKIPKFVFSEYDYYPEQLEKDLCYKTETAFAKLFHNKLEQAKDTIELTSDEVFTIQKYLIVSSLRYKYEMTENDKLIFSQIPKQRQHLYRIDSIEALEEILHYNSTEELLNYVNDIIKSRYDSNADNKGDKTDMNAQLFIETREILMNYLIFVRPRENEEFLISDVGRGSYQGKLATEKINIAFRLMIDKLSVGMPDALSMELPLMLSNCDFMLYPLTKNLAVISMSVFYRLVSELARQGFINNLYDCSNSLGFSDNKIINSRPVKKDGNIRFRIRNISTADVCHLNCISINQAKHFAACSDLSKIQQSVLFAKEKIERDISFMQLTN